MLAWPTSLTFPAYHPGQPCHWQKGRGGVAFPSWHPEWREVLNSTSTAVLTLRMRRWQGHWALGNNVADSFPVHNWMKTFQPCWTVQEFLDWWNMLTMVPTCSSFSSNQRRRESEDTWGRTQHGGTRVTGGGGGGTPSVGHDIPLQAVVRTVVTQTVSL